MSITAKPLILSKYASSTVTTEYTVSSGNTIIDKFTATNTSGGTLTISIYLVPSGGTADNSNLIIQAFSMTSGLTKDFSELQNHILSSGGTIQVVVTGANSICIRASGREIA